MSIVSRATKSAFNASRRLRGEAVVFTRDQVLNDEGFVIPPDRWQITSTATAGTLQKLIDGVWTDIENLEDLDTKTLDGNATFRVAGIVGEAYWNVSIDLSRVIQGRTEWKGLGTGGAVVISESADFLIPAVELGYSDSGVMFQPREGDRLHIQTSELANVYDVQPFGPDRLRWRWHDRSTRTIRRIYTKLLTEEESSYVFD